MQMENGVHKLLLFTGLPMHRKQSNALQETKHLDLSPSANKMGKHSQVLEKSLTCDASHQGA